MNFKEIQVKLTELTKRNISQTEIAKALNVTRSNISTRAKNNSPLNTIEIEKIERYFNVTLIYRTGILGKAKNAITGIVEDFTLNDIEKYKKEYARWHVKNYGVMPGDEDYSLMFDEDCINIEYIGISPSCGAGTLIIDEPEIIPIKLSNSLITHILKCSHHENLKVFKAQGDSMETLIEDGDLLLVDIGRTDIYNAGIYVFSVDSEWRVKRFRLRLDKVVEIISDNPKYDIELIMPDSNINLKIRGKVIKNLSRGL